MIKITKEGYKTGHGRTQRCINMLEEYIVKGDSVIYISNEYDFEEINDRIEEIKDNKVKQVEYVSDNRLNFFYIKEEEDIYSVLSEYLVEPYDKVILDCGRNTINEDKMVESLKEVYSYPIEIFYTYQLNALGEENK
ncbi:MAG: hypothetical protein RSE41_09660 [Clostridia bacterium]